MIEVRRTSAALPAIFAAAFALFTAGCSHVATAPTRTAAAEIDADDIDAEEAGEDAVEPVELDPEISKVDEASIATAGPSQIEDAIETLDAQTESRPRLVSELGAAGT